MAGPFFGSARGEMRLQLHLAFTFGRVRPRLGWIKHEERMDRSGLRSEGAPKVMERLRPRVCADELRANGHAYSVRSAVIGSMLAARCAGTMPAMAAASSSAPAASSKLTGS